jgi:hypothetical protein
VRTNSSGSNSGGQLDVVVSMYRTFSGKIVQVQRVKSTCDDLNIALFHPQIGGGFVFGTKRGNIRRIGINRHYSEIIVKSSDSNSDTNMEIDEGEDEARGTYAFCLGN